MCRGMGLISLLCSLKIYTISGWISFIKPRNTSNKAYVSTIPARYWYCKRILISTTQRKNLLLKEGQTTSLIRTFLRDAQLWSDFRTLYKQHVKEARALVKDFREKRLLYDEVNHFEDKATLTEECPEDSTESEASSIIFSDCPERDKKKKKKEKKKDKKGKVSKAKRDKIYLETKHLDELIEAMKKDCRENIRKLEKRTKDMIELVRTHLYEAWSRWVWLIRNRNLTWFLFSKHGYQPQLPRA